MYFMCLGIVLVKINTITFNKVREIHSMSQYKLLSSTIYLHNIYPKHIIINM